MVVSATTEELARRIGQVAREQFSRSSGPGGQNVNKVSTRVTVHVPLQELGLEEDELRRVQQVLAHRITTGGELVLHSDESRYREVNRKEAQNRAVTLIDSARRPRRRRKPTRPGRAARERRLASKKHRSRRKKDRRPPDEASS
jgi:ribosome-associated protein